MSELPSWLGNAILCVCVCVCHTTTETKQPREGGSLENVQILIEAINGCKNKSTTVSQAGEGKLQMRQNEGAGNERAESGAISRGRYVCVGLRFKITERLRDFWNVRK